MNRRGILLTIALMIGLVLLIVPALRREPMADGKTISQWLEILGDGHSEQTEAAAAAIQKIGTNALPWMLREIKRENSETKLWINRQASRQSLIQFQFEDEDEHRSHAATAFEALGNVAAPAIPELMRLLESEYVNSEVKQALVSIGRESISPLMNALFSPNALLREHAADTLGEFGSSAASAVPALMDCRQDAELLARTEIIEALGQIRSFPKLVIPALIQSLHDPEKYVRRDAAEALANFGGDAEIAIDALLSHVENRAESPEVQNASIGALASISRQSDRVVPVLIAQWSDNPAVRQSIVESLSCFPDKTDESLPILFEAAKGRYWWEAFNSLGKLTNRSETIAPFLVSLLKHNEPHRRYYAASALGELGDKSEQTISALKELQNDNTEFWNGSMGNETVSRAVNSALRTLQSEQLP